MNEFTTKWIPVTEDCPGPEEDGYYFVTVENREYEEPDVTIAFYGPNGSWSSDFFIRSDIVTAWVLLPDPYSGDSDK